MVLFLGGVLHPIQSDLGSVGVMVEVLGVVLEEAVLRMVSVMVLGLVLSSQIGFMLEETMRACNSQRVSF